MTRRKLPLAVWLLTLAGLSASGRVGPAAPASPSRTAASTPAASPWSAAAGGATLRAQERPPAQSADQPQQPPTFRTAISFVRVDVIVTDRQGNPVTDLAQADFEVLEDGKPQKVETFKLVKLDSLPGPGAEPARPIRTNADEESEAAREDVRIVAVFLDDYHVRRGAAMRAREALAAFLRTQLAPADMAGIMYPLTPVADVRLGRNHEASARAVERFDGRKYDYEPRNQFEEQYASYPAATVERIRNQVSLSALKALMVHLGALREGRKAVILVSEGYTNLLPPQLRDPIASMPGYRNPARGNPTAGEDDPREDTARFFASADLQTELREVYDAANRNNTAIYALDPRGLAPFEFDINEGVSLRTDAQMLQSTTDTLRVLAGETDGRAIVNRNDLSAGLKQVVRDSGTYYLLGYTSTQAPADGKFHEIKVRVRRPGTQIRARKGYWALTAEESARALAPPKPGPPPAVERALGGIADPPRGRVIRTWIGTARGAGGSTRVTFVWEPAPAVSGIRREEPARVSLVASGAEGQTYFRGRVPELALASTEPSLPAAAAELTGPARVTFQVRPGTMHLRVSVEGRTGQVLDTDAREIAVPDLTAPQVLLSTPAVLRTRNALEYRQVSADPEAVPTAAREFRRTDRLLVRFHSYGPGETVPAPGARLLNRAGQPMSDIPVRSGQGGQPHQVDLPLAGLAAGEYLLEVRARNEAGEATEFIAFRVVS